MCASLCVCVSLFWPPVSIVKSFMANTTAFFRGLHVRAGSQDRPGGDGPTLRGNSVGRMSFWGRWLGSSAWIEVLITQTHMFHVSPCIVYKCIVSIVYLPSKLGDLCGAVLLGFIFHHGEHVGDILLKWLRDSSNCMSSSGATFGSAALAIFSAAAWTKDAASISQYHSTCTWCL